MNNDVTIHIIGVGSLGSNIAHLLVRLGFETFVIYDFDDIGTTNLTNQYYFHHQVGDHKVDSLERNLKMINPDVTIIKKGKYTDDHLYGIVFLCLDSIKERRRIMEHNMHTVAIKLLIDLRLGLGEGQCFTGHRELFPKILSTMQFDDSESTTPMNACGTTMRILPTVQIITSLAVNNLINFLKNNEYHYMINTDSIEGITSKVLKITI